MNSLNLDRFGGRLQELNPHRFLVVSWQTNDLEEEGPSFHLPDSVEAFVQHLRSTYSSPFRLSGVPNAYRKSNAIIAFDDEKRRLRVSYHHDSTCNYQLYRQEEWAELKLLLIEG